MSIKVTAVEARRKFGELLNRVYLTDDEIIIERAGKEVAKLVRMDSPTAQKQPKGKLDFRKSLGLGSKLWQKINTDDYMKKERGNWD